MKLVKVLLIDAANAAVASRKLLILLVGAP